MSARSWQSGVRRTSGSRPDLRHRAQEQPGLLFQGHREEFAVYWPVR
ncbi:hypothetical protein [Streptomyces sp. LN245]